MNTIDLLQSISEQYQAILARNLIGIYVHGSIAFDCFHWDRSDVDFVVVVDNPVSQETKLELLSVLEGLRPSAPPKGFEMSVVLRRFCADFVYPTPYELHFSNDWLEKYLANPVSLCGDEDKTDCDLAAHFTVIRSVGVVLCGEPIFDVFGVVPNDCYLDSIRLDVKSAREDIAANPVYVILNLCRVYAFMKDGLVLSKEQGGQWGMNNLPGRFHDLLASMLDNYSKGTALSAERNAQMDFGEYMLEQIFCTGSPLGN